MDIKENNVVMNEAAAEAADVATKASIGQAIVGGVIGTLTVVGAVTVVKKTVEGVKYLFGKVKTFKPRKKPEDIIVENDSEEVTE